jgi:hypothetical protein
MTRDDGGEAPRPAGDAAGGEAGGAAGGAAGGEGRGPVAIIVDGANVVGSRPDGWWRDRAGAAVRLYEALARLAEHGAPGLPADDLSVVLVLEGAAKAALPRIDAQGAADAEGAADGPGGGAGRGRVRVVAAPGSGDDEIVRLAGALPGRRIVVTADRELRRRVAAAGAEVEGPSWLFDLL